MTDIGTSLAGRRSESRQFPHAPRLLRGHESPEALLPNGEVAGEGQGEERQDSNNDASSRHSFLLYRPASHICGIEAISSYARWQPDARGPIGGHGVNLPCLPRSYALNLPEILYRRWAKGTLR